MKFPRRVHLVQGRQDAAPYASVFFLLLLFVMLRPLVYTPGVQVPLDLPIAAGLPGTDKPTVTVAVDANGQLYYENELVTESELKARLDRTTARIGEPLTLIVQADKAVRYERLMRLTLLARAAGIHEALLATQPPPISSPADTAMPAAKR